MKRDFLRDLGIDEDNIKAILDQNMAEVNAAKPSDYDELKSTLETAQSQLAEYESKVTGLSDELAKSQEQINTLSADNQSFKLKDIKSNIVREYDLPASVFDNILGEDEDTIRQSAENLANVFKAVKPTQPMKSYDKPAEDDTTSGLRQMLHELKGE